MTYMYVKINCEVLRQTNKAVLISVKPNDHEIWMPKSLFKNFNGETAEVYEPVFKQNIKKAKINDIFSTKSFENEKVSLELDSKMIKKLLLLCHPDKHGNSETSQEITALILEKKKKVN